jgi:hypothetical protein
MMDYGLPPALSCYVMFQPMISCYTQSCFYAEYGAGTLYYREPDLGDDSGFDPVHKLGTHHLTMHMMSVIADPEKVLIIPHVMGDGYLGGMDDIPIRVPNRRDIGLSAWWASGGSLMTMANLITDAPRSEVARYNNPKILPCWDYYNWLYGLDTLLATNEFDFTRLMNHNHDHYMGLSFQSKHEVRYPEYQVYQGTGQFQNYGPKLRKVMDGTAGFKILPKE